MRAVWANAEKSVGNLFDDAGHCLVVEPGGDLWEEFLSFGDKIEAPPEEPRVDPLQAERAAMVVSRLQARAALLQAGLLDKVEKAVNGGLLTASATDALTRLAWNEATEFRRNSPTIAAISGLLGFGPEALDELFRSARRIEF